MKSAIKAMAACCVLSILVSGTASAANIAWVSFHSDPNDAPTTAAAGFGFTKAPDLGYTDLLRSAGHTVTRIQSVDNADVSALNAYDLVILSRSVNSGHYEADAETAAFNNLTVPLISMGGYPLRNNRLGFYQGTGIPDTTGAVRLTVNDPSHPIFAGIALDGSNTMVNDYATAVSLPHDPFTAQRGISVNTDAIVSGGTVLATVPVGAATGNVIAFLPEGTTLATSPADILGGDRLVFLSGSREHGTAPTSSEIAGIFDLTPDGSQMFLNAVDYMAVPVPEPSTGLLMLAAVGLGMLRKRR